MSSGRGGADAEPLLHVDLRVEAEGLRVRWRLTGVRLEPGDVVGRLPLSIAGAPTVEVPGAALSATDEDGRLPLDAEVVNGEEENDVLERRWVTQRTSVGAISVEYLARPDEAEPLAATPPLELRRDGDGFSGALKCFLVLPPAPEDLAFELSWTTPRRAGAEAPWLAVTSLGESLGDDHVSRGEGLERLGDTYMMWGDLSGGHLRQGDFSVWWLTPPGIDVTAFGERLGTTYRLMSAAFGAPTRPFRVFFRSHPHRGLNGSAHPASFVLAVNPDRPLEPSKIYETLAHELVHEWLRLDGSDEETRWFAEGAADYYSLVLPFRAGLVETADFLRAVNLEARTGYANPRRHLPMCEAESLFFTDFFAHWLPYTRGMFYLADLDARLREGTSGTRSVDDVVVEVTRRRRDGERVGVQDWCSVVDRSLPGAERRVLDSMVFTGEGRPGPGTFGPALELVESQVPAPDLGFDPLTLVSGRVTGLVLGGPAEEAGLREGDEVQTPTFEALTWGDESAMTVRVIRDGRSDEVVVPLGSRTVSVPQWRIPRP